MGIRPTSILALVLLAGPGAGAGACAELHKTNDCAVWRAVAVDRVQRTEEERLAFAQEFSKDSNPVDVKDWSEARKLQAIDCWLRMEDDRRDGGPSGNTNNRSSEIFSRAPAQLAALYLVSMVYTGRYDHATAVALSGPDAQDLDVTHVYATSDDAIHRAFVAYRAWFAEVQRMGLATAKGNRLDPLGGSGLRWYGQQPIGE